MKSGSFFCHKVRYSIYFPVAELKDYLFQFLRHLLNVLKKSLVAAVYWFSAAKAWHDKSRISFYDNFISITICKLCLRTHNSAWLFEADPIFFANAGTNSPLSSRITPPIPAIPGFLWNAPSMFNLCHPGGGGSHFMCKKDASCSWA